MKNGAFTLLITPFDKNHNLDESALSRLVERQVEAGIHGIAPLGVTGENTLMTDSEVLRLLEIVVRIAKGKSIIIPDTCTMSLWKTIERARAYGDLGADYVSVFAPYFILPKPDGILSFYESVADKSPVPIILHNAKGRTGVEITPEISAELARHPNIAGIKDGNKDLGHLARVIHLTRNDDFLVYTGKDTTAYATSLMGGGGTFTVAGNVVPAVMKELVEAASGNNHDKAEEIHEQYFDLFEACRFETNPMAAKRALELMGLINGSVRPPLTELGEAKTASLKTVLKKLNII